MAKVDNSWVFVTPVKRVPSAVQTQRLVRPKSSMALQEYHIEENHDTPTPGLLWRGARWAHTVKDPGNPKQRFQPTADQHKFAEFALRIRQTQNCREVMEFLELCPIFGLIQGIPQSLALLEAIYTKFYLCTYNSSIEKKFPKDLLQPENLLRQILWWVAYQENPRRLDPAFQWKVIVPYIRSVLRIVHTVAPEVTEGLKRGQGRVEKALEGLGLHGLVNCGQNKLINVTDAVKVEVGAHYQMVKGLSQQLEKLVHKGPSSGPLFSINGEGRTPAPTKSSHQRLMTLRLSNVRERVARNEFTLQVLRTALQNEDLESLERILRKRIAYDRQVISQFENFRSEFACTNSTDSIFGENPVVVEILVEFRRAYDKLLGLLPPAPPGRFCQGGNSPFSTRDDSGLGEDEDDGSGGCSSPEFPTGTSNDTQSSCGDKVSGESCSDSAFVEQRHLQSNRSSRLLGPVAHLIKSKSKGFHKSLADIDLSDNPNSDKSSTVRLKLTDNQSISIDKKDNIDFLGCSSPRLTSSKSLQQLPLEQTSSVETSASFSLKHPDMYGYRQESDNGFIMNDKIDVIRLKSEINRLGTELEIANRQIQQLSLERWPGKHNNEAYPEMTFTPHPQEWSKTSDSNFSRNSEAIKKYSILFSNDRVEIMNELNHLPELHVSEELQAKIILSVMVLAFRSVQDTIENKKSKIWDTLQISGGNEKTCASSVADLETAVLRFLADCAKKDHGMQNAKEVTSKIWQTLYDFPSLKTCTRFNRFILDCVQVAWDLLAGSNGSPPRYRLEFESNKFCPEKHFRFHSSSLRSEEIKRYIWPGLVLYDENRNKKPCNDGQIVYKGVVVT